ncbi:GDP-L-fucose synthase [Acinetobacter sp. YH12136]|uniref:GDP-L-fucose synthase n=1 Tax=Acinetobacter sp. YH12136 TaxID=2601120 RepID=UPI0015D0E988|nr:GDP-L-fucose synthase [Acinetobacter sp. YH12136]
MTPEKKQQIFVAGHQGMVGSALVRTLSQNKSLQIIVATRRELDLTNQSAVRHFFAYQHFDQVYLAAAKVGGIHANSEYPADFIYQNLMIQNNVIDAAHQTDVQKLLFLGSSCIYPKFAEQPIQEESLLAGYLEPSNEPYAIAKIAGIKLCESYNRQYGRDYRSVMPTNLYGIHDNFHDQNSHVIPALIQRIHSAKIADQKQVEIWGTGQAKREFLYVDDMASACIHVMNAPFAQYQQMTATLSHLNIGTGEEVTIQELAQLICDVIGYQGKLIFNAQKPDGTPRKVLDISRLHQLGWQHQISLKKGLAQTYSWYLNQQGQLRTV